MTKRSRSRAKAKPMRQGPKVTDRALPYPANLKAAKAEAKLLADAMSAGVAARTREAQARAERETEFAEAARIAERLRLYLEANPDFKLELYDEEEDTGRLGLTDQVFFTLEQSSRESVYLLDDEKAFVAEARRLGSFKRFVRVKEEPDKRALLLAGNRKKADLFTTAKIECERAVVIRVEGIDAPLKYVLNESEPEWNVEFPRKT